MLRSGATRASRRRAGHVAVRSAACRAPSCTRSPSRRGSSSSRIVRGEGALVFDADGASYVDAMASLWYCAIGHGRREMADAIAASGRHARGLLDASTRSPTTRPTSWPRSSSTIAPMPDARVFFTCSGSEAVDTAMKLARLAHVAGRPARNGTLIISPRPRLPRHQLRRHERAGHRAQPGGLGHRSSPDVVQVPGDDLEALATLMAERGDEVAAVITEPVQGAGGVYPPTEGYLAGLRRLCDHHGALLIFDEVITGFGRLGTWFAAHHYGVAARPDDVRQGGDVGLPAARRGVRRAGRPRRRSRPTPTTCCATATRTRATRRRARPALANLAIIEREGLRRAGDARRGTTGDGLRALAADGHLASVRGDGAVWAVGATPGRGPDRRSATACCELGVITRAIGTDTQHVLPAARDHRRADRPHRRRPRPVHPARLSDRRPGGFSRARPACGDPTAPRRQSGGPGGDEGVHALADAVDELLVAGGSPWSSQPITPS